MFVFSVEYCSLALGHLELEVTQAKTGDHRQVNLPVSTAENWNDQTLHVYLMLTHPIKSVSTHFFTLPKEVSELHFFTVHSLSTLILNINLQILFILNIILFLYFQPEHS